MICSAIKQTLNIKTKLVAYLEEAKKFSHFDFFSHCQAGLTHPFAEAALCLLTSCPPPHPARPAGRWAGGFCPGSLCP